MVYLPPKPVTSQWENASFSAAAAIGSVTIPLNLELFTLNGNWTL
jgi:hypothetical protein